MCSPTRLDSSRSKTCRSRARSHTLAVIFWDLSRVACYKIAKHGIIYVTSRIHCPTQQLHRSPCLFQQIRLSIWVVHGQRVFLLVRRVKQPYSCMICQQAVLFVRQRQIHWYLTRCQWNCDFNSTIITELKETKHENCAHLLYNRKQQRFRIASTFCNLSIIVQLYHECDWRPRLCNSEPDPERFRHQLKHSWGLKPK